jgi:iron complex outermembrane recepter protein
MGPTYSADFQCNTFSEILENVSLYSIFLIHTLKKSTMKIFFYISLCCLWANPLDAQTQDTLQEATVLANWAIKNTPIAFNNLSKAALQKNNIGQDMPYLLQQLPSVIASSDAGIGIGYTGLRVRGTDATRINVTINGVPVNDSESQAVYWVNMPDLASSVSSAQLQRGVGTSTNGAGAFGATLNLNTTDTRLNPYGNASASIGSFGTRKGTLQFGTGLMDKHWSVDGRFSKIHSDGYIQRATADLDSWFTSVAYIGLNNSVRFNVFSGKEITYHAWNGVPYQFGNDPVLRRTNTAGTEKEGTPYANQIDNYKQNHFQFVVNQQVNKNIALNVTAHATLGKGYYEEYKKAQQLKNYSADTTSLVSDLVRQRWLDNQFSGVIGAVTYTQKKLTWVTGLAVNQYVGHHFGKLIWAQKRALPIENANYYQQKALKNDASIYTKINYALTPKMNLYTDLQLRNVSYTLFYQQKNPINQEKENLTIKHLFFNPKAGFLYHINEKQSAFASFAVANKEPNRSDYLDAPQGKFPQAETLFDTELGYTFQQKDHTFCVNVYNMAYRNQLAVTGQINENSQPIRVNVPQSVRRGLELQANGRFSTQWTYNVNLAFSQNKIKNFTEYYDNLETAMQEKLLLKNTDLALSPNVVAGAELSFSPFSASEHRFRNTQFLLISKYVGRQYLDNTSDKIAALPAYFTEDFRARFAYIAHEHYNIECNLLVNNIFNKKYSNNGWSYRFQSDNYNPIADDASAVAGRSTNIYNLIGLYPQAGTHFLLEIRLGF